MNYRSLGTSGLKVSAIGLGTNQFGGKVDAKTTKNILHAALDLGINFIDTADVYQAGRSEEYIGLALEGRRQGASSPPRYITKSGKVLTTGVPHASTYWIV